MKMLAALSMLALPAFAQENPWGPGYDDFMRHPGSPGPRRASPPAARPETLPYVPARSGRSMSDLGYRSVGAGSTSRDAPAYEVERGYRAADPRAYDAPAWMDAYRTYGRR